MTASLLTTTFVALAFAGPAAACAGTLSVTVLDEHHVPTAARVYLTDPAGGAHFAPGTIAYDKSNLNGSSERHFVPPGGTFRIDLPAGPYRMLVERGKEYDPAEQQIDVPADGVVERTVTLNRWVDMAAAGWYSGDLHVHRPLKDLEALMAAEGLDAAVPITRWRFTKGINEDPDLPAFLARADADGVLRLGPHRFVTVLNEEMEPHDSALLASGLGRDGTPMRYPLAAYGRAARARGGVVDAEKATALELPALAALGACDLVGLANNHFWRTGGYVGPWGTWPDRLPGDYPPTSAGFARAGFELYASLLDMGFRLAPSAGSASGVHPVPPGWARIYAHVPGEFTPRGWWDAVHRGRSFVTTGPMLLLTVDGHEPGDDVRPAAFPGEAEAAVEVRSWVPVDAVELVVNGRPRPVPLRPAGGDHPHVYRGRVRFTLETSAWVAARWVGERPGGDGGCDVAHTGAVYFWDGPRPIPVPRREAEYLLGRVDAMVRAVEAGRPDGAATSRPIAAVTQPAEARDEALRLLIEAREVYRRKVAEAR